jgi:3'(2'), 5'-bisphosphate nucleotidase
VKTIPHIYVTAIKASIDASAHIMEVYQSTIDVEIKNDGSPVTEADYRSSKIISAYLEPLNIPITGEEREKNDYSVRSQWEENWSVDPLDGTKMFIMKNDEFSINIAHIKNGIPVFGLICSPVERKIIIGGKDLGVYLFNFENANDVSQWEKITPKEQVNSPLIIACSRSFTQSKYPLINTLREQYGEVDFLKKGSALKFFDLALGRADIYLRYAPTMEWDIAAGQAILNELGGEVRSVIDNEILKYNKKSLYNPHFIVRTKPTLV